MRKAHSADPNFSTPGTFSAAYDGRFCVSSRGHIVRSFCDSPRLCVNCFVCSMFSASFFRIPLSKPFVFSMFPASFFATLAHPGNIMSPSNWAGPEGLGSGIFNHYLTSPATPCGAGPPSPTLRQLPGPRRVALWPSRACSAPGQPQSRSSAFL